MFASLRRWVGSLLATPGQDFRPQLVAVAVLVGIPVSWLSAGINLVLGSPVETVLVNLAAGFAILGMFWFARSTGRYRLTFNLAAIALFLFVFPWLFFTGGGFYGGMPVFFMFAIAFSAIILEGVALWVLVPLELVVFGTCLVVAYQFPQTVTSYSTQLGVLLDIAFSIVATGTAMVASVRMLVGIYERNRHQLEHRNTELAQVDQAKTEFLAMVAHELNTPLTVIRAHADESARRLASRPEDDQDVRNLEVIEAESERLARLVTQLLELARINDGGMAVRVARHNLDTIVQQTLQAYRPIWSLYGNTIAVKRGSAAPEVLVDRERIVQILVNLISNAVRHTTAGRVTVGIAEGDGFAELTVADTGEGIAPGLLEQLGERPLRGGADGVRSARDAGLGVGLVITKHLVLAQGGEFSITSTVGEGTTVRCTFPLAEVDASAR
ncbi:MAG: HAMP domain-containing histidine kinase [Propionibacteriales bacterium]|nr:HAMP domain-containing histidine kinase [Propionibacteriales bacterium]